MSIRKFKPTSPSLRHMRLVNHDAVTKGNEPEKSLLAPKKKINGRNNNGRITVRRRGGGVKRRYRLIDFKRNKVDIPAVVASVEYDPNRTCHIALLNYKGFLLKLQTLKLEIVRCYKTSQLVL